MFRSMESISPGLVVEAWRCPKCKRQVQLDMEQYGQYYEAVQRRAFKLGGSIAIRLPKELAKAAHIREGTSVVFHREGRRLIIEARG